MSKRKKYERQPATTTPRVTFSLPMLRLLKEALSGFEQSMNRNTSKLENRDLAQEVVAGLKAKLTELAQLEDWEKQVGFDYNELFILYTAVHLHLVTLNVLKRYDLIPPCISLCRHFDKMIKIADAQESHKHSI